MPASRWRYSVAPRTTLPSGQWPTMSSARRAVWAPGCGAAQNVAKCCTAHAASGVVEVVTPTQEHLNERQDEPFMATEGECGGIEHHVKLAASRCTREPVYAGLTYFPTPIPMWVYLSFACEQHRDQPHRAPAADRARPGGEASPPANSSSAAADGCS
jgi:hypothetical protein